MGGQVGKKRKGGNPGVGVDFKKRKIKVGKKLPKAQNETDTSFKAASINLPSQALREGGEEGGAAVNCHNLTLKVRACAVCWVGVRGACGAEGRAQHAARGALVHVALACVGSRTPTRTHAPHARARAPTQDLLTQSGHYSEKARKSALVGLADLFARHPQELRGHVGLVYTK